MREHLTIDIGASSGKMLIGSLREGKLVTSVIHRFPNKLVSQGGHLCWDVEALFSQILEGLGKAKEQGRDIQTIAIDTWGVDFVLLDKQGLMIGSPVSYRDKRTEAVICPIGQEELYRRTGIQKMSFNTLYQLLALRQEDPSSLEKDSHLLMIPDYLSYRLTGCMHQEYTNATTTNLVDAEKRDWDR
ncbi:MAG: FGGY family carbohydrate kinase, partial [Sphaerochaetaceae bacterium]